MFQSVLEFCSREKRHDCGTLTHYLDAFQIQHVGPRNVHTSEDMFPSMFLSSADIHSRPLTQMRKTRCLLVRKKTNSCSACAKFIESCPTSLHKASPPPQNEKSSKNNFQKTKGHLQTRAGRNANVSGVIQKANEVHCIVSVCEESATRKPPPSTSFTMCPVHFMKKEKPSVKFDIFSFSPWTYLGELRLGPRNHVSRFLADEPSGSTSQVEGLA